MVYLPECLFSLSVIDFDHWFIAAHSTFVSSGGGHFRQIYSFKFENIFAKHFLVRQVGIYEERKEEEDSHETFPGFDYIGR
jgi:hypothetical protein